MTDSPEAVCAALVERMFTLQLATSSEEGVPHCGYAPFIHEADNSFYIFVSQLAAHTRHLLKRPVASIMIVADEQDSKQVFARTRVYFQCDAAVVNPEEQVGEYDRLLDAYQSRHGKMVGLLRQLPDFKLFCLTPTRGQFVMGFGQAFELTGPKLSVFNHTRTG